MVGQRRSTTTERSQAVDPVEQTLAKAVADRVAGRFQKARNKLQRVLDAAPQHAGAHHELGLLSKTLEGPGSAVPHFVAALRADPEQPRYWLALAVTLLVLNRFGEARALMEQCRGRIGVDEAVGTVLKDFTDHAFSIARERYHAGDLTSAETLVELVIGLDEAHAKATHLAGAIAVGKGRYEQAFDLFSIAVYREPDNAEFFSSLGSILILMGRQLEAVSALEKAVSLNPDMAIAHSNLSSAYQRTHRHSAAVAHARRAITLDPTRSNSHNNLACSLKSLGQLDEAIKSFDQALLCDPNNVTAHSNRLFVKLYAESVPHADYVADTLDFGKRFADPLLRRRPFRHDRTPDRRLRIGFVSSDLCAHPVARFIEPVVQHLDRDAFELRAYMAQVGEDAVSVILRTMFDGWRNIASLDDDEAADLIEADGIDILVDLSGHSAGHRLLLFARKPAPVQVTWIGHPATTGLRAIDYRLTDRYVDPPGSWDGREAETLWRLPNFFVTFPIGENIPPVRVGCPFEDNGFVTFGVLNRLEKIGDRVLRTWGEILRALPDARLFMVVADAENDEIRGQIEARLSRAGIPPERVRLHPRVLKNYHTLYYEFDVALDPFPYNGGTTSCDTLCMGVPYISLRGDHTVARFGSSLLSMVGLEELAAETPEDYVSRAVNLGRDPDRIREIRSGLRERVFASPFMDHVQFARDVGDAFRAMWQRWIATAGSV